MKPIMIKIAIGVFGFAGGFAAGFFAHKKATELKFEEITQEEMNQIEEKVMKNDIPSPNHENKPESVVSDELGAAQGLAK